MINLRSKKELFEMFLNLKTTIILLPKLKLLIIAVLSQNLLRGADNFRSAFNSSSFITILSIHVAIPSGFIDVSSISDGDVKREMQSLRS
jgi:hypothetical protein